MFSIVVYFFIALFGFATMASLSASAISLSAKQIENKEIVEKQLEATDSQSVAMTASVNAWGRWDDSVDVNTDPCTWGWSVNCENGVVKWIDLSYRSLRGY